MTGRKFMWIAVLLAVGTAASLLVYLRIAGLERASLVAGLIAAFGELAAFALGAYGLTRERASHRGGQEVTDATVGGNVTQIRGVKKRVVLRQDTKRKSRNPEIPTAAEGSRTEASQQRVVGSGVGGHVSQIDDIAGDVEVSDSE